MDVIGEVIEKWRRDGVELNPPATAASLSKLSKLLDEPVPDDLRRFYGAANGMPEFVTDGCYLSFWSIEHILQEEDFANDSLAFADFLIYSHCLRIRPIGGATRVTVDGRTESFASLEAFFEHYLRDPERFGLKETR